MAAKALDFAADAAFAALDLAYQLFDGLGAVDYMIAFFIITAVCSLLIVPLRGRGLGGILDISMNSISKDSNNRRLAAGGRQMREAREAGKPHSYYNSGRFWRS